MLIDKKQLIVISFIPRSGSTYLCDMLHHADGFGQIMEYYYPYNLEERIRSISRYEDAFKSKIEPHITNEVSWFNYVLQKGGLKCTWDAHQIMLSEAKELISTIDIKYIYLRRKNKLQQAISWYRANITQQWTSKQIKIYPNPPYNEQEIEKRLEWIEYHEQQWNVYLSNKSHIELFYETLSYDTLNIIEKYVKLRRINNAEVISEFKILRDNITDLWESKYVASHIKKCNSNITVDESK